MPTRFRGGSCGRGRRGRDRRQSPEGQVEIPPESRMAQGPVGIGLVRRLFAYQEGDPPADVPGFRRGYLHRVKAVLDRDGLREVVADSRRDDIAVGHGGAARRCRSGVRHGRRREALGAHVIPRSAQREGDRHEDSHPSRNPHVTPHQLASLAAGPPLRSSLIQSDTLNILAKPQ